MTMFFNELDLLDLKIKEESPYVDKIVVVESKWTHSGNPKPLNFPWEKYKNNNKIIYLVIYDETLYKDCKKGPEGSFHSRAEVERNLPQSAIPIASNDFVIVADLDEIVKGDQIERIIKEAAKFGHVRLKMEMYYYYINTYANIWTEAFCATGWLCSKYSFHHLRLRGEGPIIPNCGKHFSYLGSADTIKYKLQSFSHTELNTPEIINGIQERLDRLTDPAGKFLESPLTITEIDESYPKTIRDNISEWQKYIHKKGDA